jgi:hypothetical protein
MKLLHELKNFHKDRDNDENMQEKARRVSCTTCRAE